MSFHSCLFCTSSRDYSSSVVYVKEGTVLINSSIYPQSNNQLIKSYTPSLISILI